MSLGALALSHLYSSSVVDEFRASLALVPSSGFLVEPDHNYNCCEHANCSAHCCGHGGCETSWSTRGAYPGAAYEAVRLIEGTWHILRFGIYLRKAAKAKLKAKRRKQELAKQELAICVAKRNTLVAQVCEGLVKKVRSKSDQRLNAVQAKLRRAHNAYSKIQGVYNSLLLTYNEIVQFLQDTKIDKEFDDVIPPLAVLAYSMAYQTLDQLIVSAPPTPTHRVCGC